MNEDKKIFLGALAAFYVALLIGGCDAKAFSQEDERRAEYEQRLENDAFNLKNGDIILTRNLLPRQNLSPGYWNHVAIGAIRKDGPCVVEMQAEKGVVATNAKDFFRRYPEYCVLRPTFEFDSLDVAKNAWERVGQPLDYCVGASLPYRVDPNSQVDNCVSLVRRCYLRVGRDYRWRKPDDIFRRRFDDNFHCVIYADERESWREPLEPWAGLIQKR